MRVEDDLELRNLFLRAITKSEERQGIHMSDLDYCLREAYFRKLHPQPATEAELGYFVDGAARHLVLQSLHPGKAEVQASKWCLTGTVDLLGDRPIEIKTTRTRTGQINPHFFERLCRYCILHDVDSGSLIVQFLNMRDNPWVFKRVVFAPDELDWQKQEMLRRRDLLAEALRHRNPMDLPVFADAFDKQNPRWKCRDCTYRSQCEESDR